MFNWKVEEMKLMNDKGRGYGDNNKNYVCENKLTLEEKIEFVDKMQGGKLSYILNLIDKFNKDKEKGILKLDSQDRVKTVSLKAWIKKNDIAYERNVINYDYYYGRICLLEVTGYIQTINKETFIKNVFNAQLKKLEQEEYRWFLAHDEYSILYNKLEEYIDKYSTTFGLRVITGSNITLCKNEDDWEGRKFTIEELKTLISYYEKLEDFITQLSKEINIKY